MNIPEEEMVSWVGDKVALYKTACVVLGNDTLTLFDEKDLQPVSVHGYRVAPRGKRPAPTSDGQD